MKIKVFVTILLCLLSHLVFAAPTKSVLSVSPIKTIRFATEATYPPFESVDEFGVLKGFDIDIANALCQQIKAQCTFSVQSFNSLIPSLKLRKFDALIAALGITPEREKEVDFTDSYYEPTASFVALLSKNYTLKSIQGKTIGVQTGSTFERYLHDKYHRKVKIKTYSSVQDAFLDLIAGRVDLVLADSPIANAWLLKNGNNFYGVVEKPIIDHVYFGVGYGIAVRKGDTLLLHALNNALKVIKADGTYQSIAKKYFNE